MYNFLFIKLFNILSQALITKSIIMTHRATYISLSNILRINISPHFQAHWLLLTKTLLYYLNSNELHFCLYIYSSNNNDQTFKTKITQPTTTAGITSVNDRQCSHETNSNQSMIEIKSRPLQRVGSSCGEGYFIDDRSEININFQKYRMVFVVNKDAVFYKKSAFRQARKVMDQRIRQKCSISLKIVMLNHNTYLHRLTRKSQKRRLKNFIGSCRAGITKMWARIRSNNVLIGSWATLQIIYRMLSPWRFRKMTWQKRHTHHITVIKCNIWKISYCWKVCKSWNKIFYFHTNIVMAIEKRRNCASNKNSLTDLYWIGSSISATCFKSLFA